MSSTNLASHCARLVHVYKKLYIVVIPEPIFNFNESGFATRSAYRARAKGCMEREGRIKYVDLKWSANVDHEIMMPMVYADEND